jgi:serine acetyltransferase
MSTVTGSESSPQLPAQPAPAVAGEPTQGQKTPPSPSGPVPFWKSLRQDILAHVPPEQHNRSALSWFLTTLRIALLSPGFHVTFLYRFNHTISHYLGFVGRLMAGLLNWMVHLRYLTAISPRARLYGGLILPHPQNIIIGPKVVIGPRAWIFHNVTLGGIAGKEGEPTIGSDVRIRCGAVVCGPCVLGDEVEVAPNSLVQRNVPSRSLVVGVPANVYPRFPKPTA